MSETDYNFYSLFETNKAKQGTACNECNQSPISFLSPLSLSLTHTHTNTHLSHLYLYPLAQGSAAL
jgi:hypothetical protein